MCKHVYVCELKIMYKLEDVEILYTSLYTLVHTQTCLPCLQYLVIKLFLLCMVEMVVGMHRCLLDIKFS